MTKEYTYYNTLTVLKEAFNGMFRSTSTVGVEAFDSLGVLVAPCSLKNAPVFVFAAF